MINVADEVFELSDEELDNIVGGLSYEILPGDTLSEIGERYNVSVEQLLAWNPFIENRNYIQAGWTLNIKTPQGTGAQLATHAGTEASKLA